MQPNGITRTAEIVYVAVILSVALVWRRQARCRRLLTILWGRSRFRSGSATDSALGGAMLVRLVFGRSLGRAAQSMVVGLDEAVGEGARRRGAPSLP